MARTSLNKWLMQCGFTDNPFEISNAEYEAQIPKYFVDNAEFDEILCSRKPCVIFAARGSGKTALRQMLSAEFRGQKYLVVFFTYPSYERILAKVHHKLENIQISHHIDTILNGAILAMPIDDIFRGYVDPGKDPQPLDYLRCYVERFAPEVSLSGINECAHDLLKSFGDYQLLEKFATLIQELGYKACVVLVDNLDEFFISNRENPIKNMTDLIAPLIGTMSVLECPGMMFRFFLPAQIENELRQASWFRPDRLRVSSIFWGKKELKKIIQNRVSYYSNGRYPNIAALCKDDISPKIEDELILVAKGIPRSAIEIAYQLLQNHVMQDEPGFQISQETWKETRRKFETTDQPEQRQGGSPELIIDHARGEVWLGKKEFRKKITPQDYQVLLCLYNHRPETCSKIKIIDEAWKGIDGVSDEAITASIKRLRDIFRNEGFEDYVVIDTIRGSTRNDGGYKIPQPIYHHQNDSQTY